MKHMQGETICVSHDNTGDYDRGITGDHVESKVIIYTNGEYSVLEFVNGCYAGDLVENVMCVIPLSKLSHVEKAIRDILSPSKEKNTFSNLKTLSTNGTCTIT